MPNAIITAVSGYVPEQILSNLDLEKIMDTSDEWIRTRTGIEERRVMPSDQAVTEIGVRVTEDILAKSGVDPSSIDLVICATCTADYILPDSANGICKRAGLKKAFGFDLNAACSGFVYALYTGAQFVQTGAYRRVLVIGAEKLTSYMNYADRTTSIIFGDGGGGVLLEPSDDDELGIIDAVLCGDGDGVNHLRITSGGSLVPTTEDTLSRNEQYLFQDGKSVFKRAVKGMTETIQAVMERNALAPDDIRWLVPHQANLRIIKSVADQVDFPMERIMVNIEKYGNTSAGTIPLCLWEYEDQMKKGDGIMLTAFGGGFTWGSLFLRWAY
ncbi:MAG: beta-ketoacyl-ACP synthase III [Bacteroidota bacterium]